MRLTIRRASVGLIVAALLQLCACIATGTRSNAKSFLTGNPADVRTPTAGLLVLQGGGDDVDMNYVRMGALSGGGDFVVLRASGDDGYNDYIFALCQCDSVETLIIPDRAAAHDEHVVATIRNAEALFIAGGDQSNYVRFWQGTPVEDAIHFVASKPAPVGGTSAGMAVMGEFSYSAMTPESLTAAEALADPYTANLTLERDFLHLEGLENLIMDQHLLERDRLGRTVTMLARLRADGWTSSARAMAADRETAAHVDPATGNVEIFAVPGHETPFVYFLQLSQDPEQCTAGVPLTVHGMSAYRVSPGSTFNLFEWRGTGGIDYTIDVTEGKLLNNEP